MPGRASRAVTPTVSKVARAKREDSVEIELISAQEILDLKIAVSQMH